MKTTNFNWGDTTIDSRDIIARHEELTDARNNLVELIEAAEEDLNEFIKDNGLTDYTEDEIRSLQELQEEVDGAKSDLAMFNTEDALELLNKIVEECEDSPDWAYGEVLIRESYFTDYIKDLINDCYDYPTELNDGKWPWNHLIMDWEAAAEEAKADYFTIETDGETYYIRA